MKINHFLQLIILFLCFVWHGAVQAAYLSSQEATVWAQKKGEEIIDILAAEESEQKQKNINAIMDKDIDIDYAAKFVVGKYWRLMSEKQKARYFVAFKNYLKSSYRDVDLDLQKGDISFTIDKAEQNGETIDVFCTIMLKNFEEKVDEESKGGINVIFALVKNNNTIQVRDLKIAESSFLISLRQRFYKMIHEDDDDEIDWFLDDLEASTQDNLQNNFADF